MKIIQCDQGTDEWFEARRGIPSSSNFDKIITTKGEPSKQAEKYMFRLAGEVVSKTTEETYKNSAMERGSELEAEARQLYQIINDVEVIQAGFCLSADGKCGCSPDGLIGEDGGLEIKCPNMATHVGYLIDNKLPTDYFQQVQGSLKVTGRKWWDFMSYYPSIKPLIIRVYPDQKFISSLNIEIDMFHDKLQTIIKQIGE